MCAGTTPQPPCTKNCMRKPPRTIRPVEKEGWPVGRPVGAVLVPGRGFLHLGADEKSEERRQAADEEKDAPGGIRMARVERDVDGAEGQGGQEVAHRVALLEEPREHP